MQHKFTVSFHNTNNFSPKKSLRQIAHNTKITQKQLCCECLKSYQQLHIQHYLYAMFTSSMALCLHWMFTSNTYNNYYTPRKWNVYSIKPIKKNPASAISLGGRSVWNGGQVRKVFSRDSNRLMVGWRGLLQGNRCARSLCSMVCIKMMHCATCILPDFDQYSN